MGRIHLLNPTLPFWKGSNHMITGLLILEDISIKFDIREDCRACQLTISDGMSGEAKTVEVDNEQLGAIIGTAICGTNEKVMEVCSPLVHAALDGKIPHNLWPSPL